MLRHFRLYAGKAYHEATRIAPRIRVDYRQKIADIPPKNAVPTPWDAFQERIALEAFSDAALKPDFLRTDTILSTVGARTYTIGQKVVDSLKADPYGRKLLSMVSETPFGHPFLLPTYPLLSSVGAQNLYYILLMKNLVNEDPFTYTGNIVDFGGGYGYLSRAITLVNDNARVYVLDLPILGIVQKAFHEATLRPGMRSRISYISSPQLQSSGEALDACEEWLAKPFHFNATFSLNECDENTQMFFIETIVRRSKTFVIVYADVFQGIRNKPIYHEALPRLCKDHEIKYQVWDECPFATIVSGRRKST